MASVWGIDIGKAALKAVKLRRIAEGLEIQAIEYLPYPVEEDEDERQEHVNDAIRTFLGKHKLGSDQVIVGIPGLHAFSRFIKLPPVDKSKVGMMVRMEAQQQIPFPIAEVNWDFTILDRDYEPGEEIEVGIFATRSELIDGFLGDMKENGLFPDIVTIAPLAVYNFLRYNSESEEGGTIILDIGAEHTDLVIMDEERFWIRNLRIAGNDITKALADRFKIPFAEAEKLKKSSSKSAQSKKIFNSMESVLKDLIGEIHRSVGFFKSQADDLSVKRMILMGDGSKLKSLAKYLKQQLKYDVRRVTQLEEERFVLGEEVDVDVISKHILGFGVGIGLAIQGLREARCSINLAPQQLQIQSKLKKKIPFAILTAVAAWACLGLSHVYWTKQRDSVKGTLKSLSALRTVEDIQQRATAAKAELPALEQVSKPYANLGEGRTLLLEFVNKLNTVLPTKNDVLPKIDQNKKLDDKMQAFNDARAKEKFNFKKTWLLSWNTSRKQPSKPGEQVPYSIELRVAKALDKGASQGASDVRAKIKTEIADKLTEQLSGAPFWIRKPGTTNYGKMEISTSKDIYAVYPDREEEFGRNPFHCIMVTLKFEIGIAPPPKKEAPKPADGQPQEGN